MKVNGIELLQMIKDGKIKEGTIIKDYFEDGEGFTQLIYINKNIYHLSEYNNYKSDNGMTYLQTFLSNDTFEIIEEDKPIEKLDGSIGYLNWNSEAVVITNKINELIKEINKLKMKKLRALKEASKEVKE